MPLSANFRREMLTALKNAKKNKDERKDSDEVDDGGGSSGNATRVEVTPAVSEENINPSQKTEVKSSKTDTTPKASKKLSRSKIQEQK